MRYANPAPAPGNAFIDDRLKLFMVTSGTEDMLYANVTSFVELLKKYNVKHEILYPSGGYTWMNCRLYISTFAPRIFR